MTVNKQIDSSKQFINAMLASSSMDNQRSYMHARNVFVSILNKENVNTPFFWHWICDSSRYLPIAVSVVVMDGVTIGHPRCAVDGCKMPLATVWDRYCLEHRSSGSLCSI